MRPVPPANTSGEGCDGSVYIQLIGHSSTLDTLVRPNVSRSMHSTWTPHINGFNKAVGYRR